MNKVFAPVAILALTSAFALPVLAETITVPIGQQAQDKQSLSRPTTGMSKQKVEAVFGAPNSAKPDVGVPPITTWFYNDFTVYFEYDHVIHTVLTHTPQVPVNQ